MEEIKGSEMEGGAPHSRLAKYYTSEDIGSFEMIACSAPFFCDD